MGWVVPLLTMMALVDDVVGVVAVVVVPVEGEDIARLDLDGVAYGTVAKHIAPHVHAAEILDGAVAVPSRRWPIEAGHADSAERPLVDAVDVNALVAETALDG